MEGTRGVEGIAEEGSEGPIVADVMQPLPARLTLRHSVAAARELMEVLEYSFLVVVAPATGKLLGVVLRRSLERCEARGHDPESCMLVQHVKTDIDFCLETETLDEVFGKTPATIAPPGGRGSPNIRRRNALPVVVVDEYKIPVGLLRRPRPSESSAESEEA